MKLFSRKPFAFQFCLKQILLCILLFVISCATSDTERNYDRFTFIKSNKEASKFKIKKRIAIQTFADNRELDNISYGGLAILPLFPYGSHYENRPEMIFSYQLNFLPEMDLAKAMESELTDYHLFEKVFYTDRTSPKNADYLITCRLKKDQIYSKRTFYGTGILFFSKNYIGPWPYLWLVIETTFYTMKAEIELEIKDIKTNKIILKKIFLKEESDWDFSAFMYKRIAEKYISMNQELIHSISQEIIHHFEGIQK